MSLYPDKRDLLGFIPFIIQASYDAGIYRKKWRFKRFKAWAIDWIWGLIIIIGALWGAWGVFKMIIYKLAMQGAL